jgi:hypothetical protein
MAVDVTPDSAAIRVERRHFLRTAGAAGFALAVQPVRAQQVVSTSSDGLVTGSSQVAGGGGGKRFCAAAPVFRAPAGGG